MDSLYPDIAAIVLAAGKGTRMKSSKAKVLHLLAGRPIIRYVIETALKVVGHNIVVVVGNEAEAVRKTVTKTADVLFAYQEVQLGTGHAVQCALPSVPSNIKNVIILCGDVPLITEQTIKELVDTHLNARNAITLLGVNIDNPTGYGRLIIDSNGEVQRIVEETDATKAEKAITTINSGIYCIHSEFLMSAINQLNSNNAQNEIYLTDIIEVASNSGLSIGMMLVPEYTELIGINTLDDLDRVEAVIEARGKSLDFGFSEIL